MTAVKPPISRKECSYGAETLHGQSALECKAFDAEGSRRPQAWFDGNVELVGKFRVYQAIFLYGPSVPIPRSPLLLCLGL